MGNKTCVQEYINKKEMRTYELLCTHDKHRQIVGQIRVFGLVSEMSVFSHCEAHYDLVCACHMNVCAVGSCSMNVCAVGSHSHMNVCAVGSFSNRLSLDVVPTHFSPLINPVLAVFCSAAPHSSAVLRLVL